LEAPVGPAPNVPGLLPLYTGAHGFER